jgi:hypothetical protein
MLYADTSALLPYDRAESTSATVGSLLLAQSKPALISDFTRVASESALDARR